MLIMYVWLVTTPIIVIISLLHDEEVERIAIIYTNTNNNYAIYQKQMIIWFLAVAT